MTVHFQQSLAALCALAAHMVRSPMLNEQPLTGCRVLIVEDEYLLADDLRVALKSLGANVIALVGDLDEALDLLAHGGFDVAVIDINLRGDLAFTIADQLQRRGIPF